MYKFLPFGLEFAHINTHWPQFLSNTIFVYFVWSPNSTTQYSIVIYWPILYKSKDLKIYTIAKMHLDVS